MLSEKLGGSGERKMRLPFGATELKSFCERLQRRTVLAEKAAPQFKLALTERKAVPSASYVLQAPRTLRCVR